MAQNIIDPQKPQLSLSDSDVFKDAALLDPPLQEGPQLPITAEEFKKAKQAYDERDNTYLSAAEYLADSSASDFERGLNSLDLQLIYDNHPTTDKKENERRENVLYYKKNKEKFQQLPADIRALIMNTANADIQRTSTFKKSTEDFVGHITWDFSETEYWDNVAQEYIRQLEEKGYYDTELLDYAIYVQNYLDNTEHTVAVQQETTENPWKSNFESVTNRPQAGLDSIVGTIFNTNTFATDDHYRPIDPNSIWHRGSQDVNTIRNTTQQMIASDYPNIINPLSGGNLPVELYNGTMGTADWLYSYLTTFGYGVPTAIVNGTGGMGQGIESVFERGGTRSQALQNGSVNWLTDALFSFLQSKMVARFPTSKTAIGATNFLGNYGQYAANYWADNSIMLNQSFREQRIQDYMLRDGLSREEAEKKENEAFLRQALSTDWFIQSLAQNAVGRAISSSQSDSGISEQDLRLMALFQRQNEDKRGSQPLGEGAPTVADAAAKMAGVSDTGNSRGYTDQDMEIARIMQDEAGSNPLGEKNDISIEDAAAKMAGVDNTFTKQQIRDIMGADTLGADLVTDVVVRRNADITAEDARSIVSSLSDKERQHLENFNQSHPNSPDVSPELYALGRYGSVHNPDKDTAVLGKYNGGGPDSYITHAGTENTYFDFGTQWEPFQDLYGFTDEDMFYLFNVPFLDDCIAQGKTIRFVHDPRNDQFSLRKEYDYLLDHDYENIIIDKQGGN